MNLFDSLSGMVTVELTSAEPEKVLGDISNTGVQINRVSRSGDLTVRFEVHRHALKKLERILAQKGASFEIKHRTGIYWSIKGIVRRPVLFVGLVFLLLLAIFLPSRIFFVQVEGNVSIPGRLILEEAEYCGISFGSSRRVVRSEKVKNALLQAIPELQWAGVNTKGCVAVISVREKTQVNETRSVNGVSSIVANRDGVIISCTVEQGNAQCKVGQAVRKGQLLISGYTDCGISIRAGRSVGEVFAQTKHEISAVTPAKYLIQQEMISLRKKYAVVIGKKRINFYKDSGILGSTCDKMSTVKNMTLPGGFVLPLALVIEEWVAYDCVSGSLNESNAERLLSGFSQDYLRQQMLAGQVLTKTQGFTNDAAVWRMHGSYACIEMIGREQREEILEEYE